MDVQPKSTSMALDAMLASSGEETAGTGMPLKTKMNLAYQVNQARDGDIDVFSRNASTAAENHPSWLIRQFSRASNEVVIEICSHLDIKSIVALTRTCKALSQLYNHCRPSLWNINRSLRRYVDKPEVLRSQMAIHNALIAGPFALQFLDRTYYKNSDLDIFQMVATSDQTLSIADHFVQNEGYKLTYQQSRQRTDGHGAFLGNIKIKTLARVTSSDGSDDADEVDEAENVNVFEIQGSDRTPISYIIKHFWCTTLLNVVSWNKAYAINARETFITRELYLTNVSQAACMTPMPDPAVMRGYSLLIKKFTGPEYDFKYMEQRRWWNEPIPYPSPSQSRTMRVFGDERMVGDKRTWIVNLSPARVAKSSLPATVLEATSWEYYRGNRFVTNQINTLFSLVVLSPYSHPCLRYQYHLGGEWRRDFTRHLDYELLLQRGEVNHDSWEAFVALYNRERSDEERQTWKLVQRLPGNSGLIVSNRFQYFDDEIVKFFRKFHNSLGRRIPIY